MTLIWAHRGASSYAPENTLLAFELAFDYGADGVELDVQRTRDGVLVVCHDTTVDRTSDGVGSVADLTYDEIRNFNFSNGFDGLHRMPMLDEVLDLVALRDGVVNIELKDPELYPGIAGEVDAMVCARGMSDRVWYSSFDHDALAPLVSSASPIAILYKMMVDPVGQAVMREAHGIHPHHALLVQRTVERAHADGLRVHCWTVDDPSEVTRLASWGVDAIITNDPKAARRALDR